MRRTPTRTNAVMIALLVLSTLAFANPLQIDWTRAEMRVHDHKSAAQQGTPSDILAGVTDPLGAAACVNGVASTGGIDFECDGIDLLRFIPVNSLDNNAYGDGNGFRGEGSDVWGWTSPDTGEEYVLMGKTNATAFFRIVDNDDTGLPDLSYLGELPNPGSSFSVWKDIKVYDNHAYIVAEASDHGMQVFDLTQLDDAEEGFQEFAATAHYLQESNNSHNMVINTDNGSAYIVGSVGTAADPLTDVLCDRGGLHRVDITDPANPAFGGCYTGDLYVHDAHCVVYRGPVVAYQGKELCFNAVEQWLSVVDMTDAANPTRIGLFPYPNSSYVHQGWLTDDHRFFLLGDEGDEGSVNTRTMIYDFSESLSAPQLPTVHVGPTAAIDHNMYVKNGLLYQSNYAAGLRVQDTAGLYEGVPSLEQIAFFDNFPDHNDSSFVGTWSNYPWFDDGVVALNTYDGLFLLQMHDDVLAAEEFDPNA